MSRLPVAAMICSTMNPSQDAPSFRVREQLFVGFHGEQGVYEAAVAHEDLRRLDEALARIRMPWRQTPHQHEISRQIEVSSDRLTGYA